MAHAPTGSGKTPAFLVPIIQKVVDLKKTIGGPVPNVDSPYAIILTPIRDLSDQVYRMAERLSKGFANVRTAYAYGGTNVAAQGDELRKGCDILCGTEGRLYMLLQNGKLKLDQVRFFVIDEADKLLSDFDSMPEIHRNIKAQLPPGHRTFLFSATFDAQTQQIAAERFLRTPYFCVSVGGLNQAVSTVKQELIIVPKFEKRYKLLEYLTQWKTGTSKNEHGDEVHHVEKTLVFMEVKRQTDWLASWLSLRGFKAMCAHGGRSQLQRAEAFAKFRDGTYEILVASDIAARGLNVPDIRHVVLFDIYGEEMQYVHRIGRTGRMGNEGHAVVFFDPEEESNLRKAPALIELFKLNGLEVPASLLNIGGAADDDDGVDDPLLDWFDEEERKENGSGEKAST